MLDSVAKYRSMIRISVSVCCMSMIAIGCGGGGGNSKVVAKPRVSATGKITLDGKPVVAGSISFVNNETGNAGSGTIVDGTYTVKAAEGPNPGASAVVVIAKEKAGEDDKWQWSDKVDVPATGYTGDFAIVQKQTKPARKKVIDN